MGTITPSELLKLWKLEKLSVEMAVGHILQNLVNMHTTIEMVDLHDLETCVRLLTAFALDLKKNQKFKVKV